MRKNLFHFAFYILAVLLFSCSGSQNKTGFEELTPHAFHVLQQSRQGVILDVRTPEEFAAGHIDQSKNIDYKDSSFEPELNKLDKEAPYFVYCKSGVRSSKAGDLMQEMGFTNVYLLDGGIDAWEEAGLPVNGE